MESVTSEPPSYIADEPNSNPPPKIQNSTGRLSSAVVPAGRLILRERQSSPAFVIFWKRGVFTNSGTAGTRNWLISVDKRNCGHERACPVAWILPRSSSSLRCCGGFNLRDPVGGCAKGTPLNRSILLPGSPIIVAEGDERVTVGGCEVLLARAARAAGNKAKKNKFITMVACSVP